MNICQSKPGRGVLLSAVLLTSAMTLPCPQRTAAAPAKGPAKTPAKAPAKTQTKVAATVNSEAIPMSEVDEMVAAVKEGNPELNASTPEAQKALAQVREQVLDNLVEQSLLYQKAVARNIKPSNESVSAELANIKKTYKSDAEYQKWLADSGKTEADLRRILIRDLAIEELFKQITADVAVTDADIQEFYNKNPEMFTQPERVSVRQIWIAARQDAPPAERAKAKARATTLAQQARGNVDFGKLAFDNSDDPVTKERGGDLGLVSHDSLIAKPLLDAIFNTPVGQVAGPIESKSGYHIIKVESKLPAVLVPLDPIKEQVRPVVLRAKISEKFNKQVDEWKKQADIKKNL